MNNKLLKLLYLNRLLIKTNKVESSITNSVCIIISKEHNSVILGFSGSKPKLFLNRVKLCLLSG